MSLFDDIKRIEDRGATYKEAHYDYLNRSGRPEFKNARQKIDELFSKYKSLHPESASDLESRLKSKDNRTHLGAITELYTHNLLLNNDFSLTPHPTIPNRSEHPDFLANKDGQGVYVESTSLVGSSGALRTAKFEADILDAVNQLQSPDFLISVDFKFTSGQEQPAVGKIKKKLQSFIDSLDYSVICKMIEKGLSAPILLFESKGWRIEFMATPVKEEARGRRAGKDTRSVGMIMHPVKTLRAHEMLREKIKEKRKKYGKLDKPLLLVVNAIYDNFFMDDYTVMTALFGEEKLTFTTYSDGTQKTTHGRTMNGAWIQPSGKILSGVSGVLILPGLFGWNMNIIKPKLWIHPKANHLLKPGLIKIMHKVHDSKTDRMEEVDYGQ